MEIKVFKKKIGTTKMKVGMNEREEEEADAKKNVLMISGDIS